jgi:hypothetical protein
MAEEKTVSTHFNCPHCRGLIEKPFQYQLFAGGARGIGMVASAEDTCPYCGRGINRQAIIDGAYDPPKSKSGGWVGIVIFVIVLIVLAKACS